MGLIQAPAMEHQKVLCLQVGYFIRAVRPEQSPVESPLPSWKTADTPPAPATLMRFLPQEAIGFGTQFVEIRPDPSPDRDVPFSAQHELSSVGGDTVRASLDCPHWKVQSPGLAQALPLAKAPLGSPSARRGVTVRKAACPPTWLPHPASGEELAAGPKGTKRERVVGSAHIHPRSEHKDSLQPSHASGKSGVHLWKPGGSCVM